jgi:hypothetical protein
LILYPLTIERKIKKGRNGLGLFSQGRYTLLAVPHRDFSGYSGAI